MKRINLDFRKRSYVVLVQFEITGIDAYLVTSLEPELW